MELDNRELSDCLVMEVLKFLKEEEEKTKADGVNAGIIRSCISLILREVKDSNSESF